MTDEEYRQRILDSEKLINLELERQKLRVRRFWQSTHRADARTPGITEHRKEYVELIEAAKKKMAEEASQIERKFYDELEEEE